MACNANPQDNNDKPAQPLGVHACSSNMARLYIGGWDMYTQRNALNSLGVYLSLALCLCRFPIQVAVHKHSDLGRMFSSTRVLHPVTHTRF